MLDERVIIDKYLGIPYKEQGQDLSGLCCWWLLVLIYRDLGYEVWEYSPEQDRAVFMRDYFKHWEKVKVPGIYDVALIINKGQISHCGIVLSHNKFIHSTQKGVIVSRLASYMHKIEGFYHLRVRYDNG